MGWTIVIQSAAIAIMAMTASCQIGSVEGPDLQRLPSCAQGSHTPIEAGRGRARVRWVYVPDSAFRAQSVQVSLDGQRVQESHDLAQLEKELLVLTEVDLGPGQHRIDTVVKGAGQGSGPFSYLADYRYERPSQLVFSIQPGQVRCISLVVYYRDGITLPIEQRPVAELVAEGKP